MNKDLNNSPFLPVFGVGIEVPIEPPKIENKRRRALSGDAVSQEFAPSTGSVTAAGAPAFTAPGGSVLFQAPPPLEFPVFADDLGKSRGGKRSRMRDGEVEEKPFKRNRDKVRRYGEDTADDYDEDGKNVRLRGRRQDACESVADDPDVNSSTLEEIDDVDESEGSSRRRRRRRRPHRAEEVSAGDVMEQITALKGSTRLEAKRIRRREGRKEQRRPTLITEAEFLARRESVDRHMIVREQDGLNQIAVLEDGMLVEHFVARHTQATQVGSIYLGRVQNVLPSMEAAFVDLGSGRNAVLYAGEVDWEAVGLKAGKQRKIESALSPGDPVMVQVTKDPIGHKGARLTSQITLAGRYLVLVPGGGITGISRKLPEKERRRLKKVLKEVVPKEHGVIVRTAAEGATEEQLGADIKRLVQQWEEVQEAAKQTKAAPKLLHGEPELALRVVRDIFNEDFQRLTVQGKESWQHIRDYVQDMAPDLVDRLHHWTSEVDVFAEHRIDEQLAKGLDRKVWLPSGGYLIIDRTEAMTVVDVNTGKYTGGGTLEETVTRNNLESAEEIARQLRLRDIGGIIVIDFVDMVLEANRDLVLRRLIECLARDRTRHQVTEVTSLGLVQMTRKRVGQGLVEAFSTPCTACEGRGFILHEHPVERGELGSKKSRGKRDGQQDQQGYTRKSKNSVEIEEADDHSGAKAGVNQITETNAEVRSTLAAIARAGKHEDHADGDVTAQDENTVATTAASGGMQRRGRKRGRRTASADVVDTAALDNPALDNTISDSVISSSAIPNTAIAVTVSGDSGRATEPVVKKQKNTRRRRASSPSMNVAVGEAVSVVAPNGAAEPLLSAPKVAAPVAVVAEPAIDKLKQKRRRRAVSAGVIDTLANN